MLLFTNENHTGTSAEAVVDVRLEPILAAKLHFISESERKGEGNNGFRIQETGFKMGNHLESVAVLQLMQFQNR